jgi:hypothetical protein
MARPMIARAMRRGGLGRLNLQLNASVASGLLTVAVKAANTGADPTSANPVAIPFRDATLANGDPVVVQVTSALSINTNAVGASLGTQNGVPFRLWIVAFNNAGTPVLALWHSGAGASAPAINPLDETSLPSTTGIGAAANAAGTFYTPNGTNLSSKAFRIIGYAEWGSGLAAAGNYTSAPTKLQLFGPGVRKPGDVVQKVYGTTSTATNVSSTTKTVTALLVALTPTSPANLVQVSADGFLNTASGAGTGTPCLAQLYRGTTGSPIGNLCSQDTGTSGSGSCGTHNFALDNPQTTSSTTYGVMIFYAAGTAGTVTFLGTGNSVGTNSGVIVSEEIMC